jgi:pimeloyl-ACP methyl ester carboxylesterase
MNTYASRFVRAGGLRFHVLDWGQAGMLPLFLLHGLASSAHMFDLIAPALSERFHVFAIDQRGHGLSDKPTDGYDFETIASDLDHVIDALGFGNVQVPIVGHSWGAYTVLYYASTRARRTMKIAMLDGGIRPLTDRYATWREAEIEMAPPQHVNPTLEGIRHIIREDWLGDFFRPELEPLALSIFDTSDSNNVVAHLRRENHMQIAYHLWRFEPEQYYAHVDCPALIVIAVPPNQEIEPQLLTYANTAETGMRQAEVIWMRETSHDIPWHRPVTLLETLNRFL